MGIKFCLWNGQDGLQQNFMFPAWLDEWKAAAECVDINVLFRSRGYDDIKYCKKEQNYLQALPQPRVEYDGAWCGAP